MSASRGDGRTDRSERGQSTLIGIVLLIGMVAAGSLGILLVAGDVMNSAEQQSEQERIEQTFIELSHSIASSSAAGDVSQSMELHAGESGAIAHHDSATYRIWTESYNDTGETNDVAAGTIGTIEYEDEDGTRIAYEGGAVFRETGERTQLLSEPAINYDHETSTLSFPVVRLAEEKTINSGNVNIRQTGVEPASVNYIQDDHVYVEIESEYCRGWEQYFVDQAGDATLQEECYGGGNAEGTVKVRLGYDDIADAFSSGASISSEENYEEHQSGGELTDLEEGNFKPIDDTIYQMVDDYDGNETNIDNDSVDWNNISSGKYFADKGSLDGADELTFNLEDGDAILVVDDDISGYDVTVESCGPNGDNQLKIYSTGDLDLSVDSSVFDQKCGDDTSNLQVYGTSTMAISLKNGDYEGLIYAASDKEPGENGFDGWQVDSDSSDSLEYQVYVQGSPEFEGSIVAHSIEENSNFDNFDTQGIDSSQVNVVPEGYEPAPQLTFLNLAEHTIEIRSD